MNDDDLKMPWKGIAKVSGAAAAITALVTTAMCASAIAREREERRPRWTDAARWERD